MKLVAITGSIGCGKTTIAKIIKSLGYVVFDVDAWVRRLYFHRDFIDTIVKNFPDTCENGVFCKRKCRCQVWKTTAFSFWYVIERISSAAGLRSCE